MKKKKKTPNFKLHRQHIGNNNISNCRNFTSEGVSYITKQRTLSNKSIRIIHSNKEQQENNEQVISYKLAKIENIATYWHSNVIHYQFHVTHDWREYYLEEMWMSTPRRPVMVPVGPHSTSVSPYFRSHMVFLWKSGWSMWFGWVCMY